MVIILKNTVNHWMCTMAPYSCRIVSNHRKTQWSPMAPSRCRCIQDPDLVEDWWSPGKTATNHEEHQSVGLVKPVYIYYYIYMCVIYIMNIYIYIYIILIIYNYLLCVRCCSLPWRSVRGYFGYVPSVFWVMHSRFFNCIPESTT